MKLRSTLSAACAIATVSTSASVVGAQTQTGYAASSFEPSERGSDWFANESLDLRGNFRPAIGIVGDYGYRSVISNYAPDGTILASVVRNQVLVHPGASFVLFDRLRLGLSLPIALYNFGHQGFVGGVTYPPPANQQGVGDLRVSLDVRLLGTYGDAFTLAAGASVFAPIGSRDAYTGDEVVRLAPRIMAAGDVGDFAYAVRVGYQYRDLTDKFLDSQLGSTFTFGGAVGVRVLDKKLLIGPEMYGQTVITNSHAFEGHATPIEAILGVHYNVSNDIRLNAGAGAGATNGYGAAMFRGLVSIEWAPAYGRADRDHDGVYDDEDACPDVAGVRTTDPKTNGCPATTAPSDRDGDGVLDADDACPDVPGVKTDDPKTNGCPPPPPDRDGDGIPDNVDACPDVPGVKTDDPKTNGCPSDRDKDGIYDKDDACPDVAGVKTDDPKTNGCPPDLDRDKDGIPNDVDACPDVPGPKSDDPKTTGCPRVFIKNAQIQILEQPKFDFNRAVIKKESDSLLTEVAKVMADHPEIKQVRVEGHTDSVGNAQYNKVLSQQRAQAVVSWLIAHGVDKARLTAKGMGKESPLVSNDTDAGRALNRRVEFHIETQDATSHEEVKKPGGGSVPAPPVTKPIPAGATPTPKKDIPKDAPPPPKP